MRRLNVKLALWLVGITVFSAVGVHLLHGYQLGRNADFLKTQAEKARDDGDVTVAIKKYNQYLRHRDDRDGYKALAELVVGVAKEAGATNQDKFRAYNILEEAIRRHPDLDEVRVSLVDYTMMMGRFQDVQEHIKLLQENGNNDPELEYKSAVCYLANGDEELARKKLCSMVGYEDELEQFKEEPPATAKNTKAFVLLAQIFRGRSGNKERGKADAVMSQLVKWNPDSSEAHLMRGRYLLSRMSEIKEQTPEAIKERDTLLAEGKAECETALQLAPDNADAVLAVATTAMAEKNNAKAQELLDRALKEHPDRQEVYVRLSELAVLNDNKNLAGAESQLQEGLKKATETRPILERLIEIQFQANDLAAVRASLDQMRKIDTIPAEYIRYQEARLKLADGKVVEATRELERVRPAMERLGTDHAQRVNSFLAQCYETLGLPDQQLEVYRRLLGSYPNLLVARLGEARALQSLGRWSEAETSVALLAGAAHLFPPIRGMILQLTVNQQMSKPAEERNWEMTDKVAALLYQDTTRTPAMNQLLKADLLMAQDRDDEALELLTAARKEMPNELAVWNSLSKLLARDESKRDKIPQLLALAQKEVGDVPLLRMERIRVITEEPGENALAELNELEKGIDKFTEIERRQLLQRLGRAYLRIGNYDQSKRCWNSAIAIDPTNGNIRQLVFELAMERRDEEQMKAVLKEIRDSRVFGPESPLYKYCDASYALQAFDGQRRDPAKLTEDDRRLLDNVRRQVVEATAARPEWAPLWRVRGEVDQLEGNFDGAIDNYQRSLNFSRFNQETTARRLVTLLYAARRFGEANEALKYLSGGAVPEEFRHLIQDTKRRSGDATAALVMAKKDVEAHPENPSNHIWYGQLLETVGQTDEAAQAFREATKAGPQLPRAWELLVRRLLADRKKNEAVEAVRSAYESLSDDSLSMAQLYQLVGDLEQADKLYESALAKSPDDLHVLQRVAQFNFEAGHPDKATALLEQLIAKGPKSDDKDATNLVHWARRAMAQNLAAVGDFQNTMAAVKLIKKNAANGQLSRLDLTTIVGLLGDRPEHVSRAESLRLLEEVQKRYGLSARQMAAMGKLYSLEGQWDQAKKMFLAAINNRSDDPAILSLFAKLLLDHEEAEDAQRYVDQAEELIAKSTAPVREEIKHEVRTTQAHLLIRDGQKEKAAEVMEGLLVRPLPQSQLFRLDFLARQMEIMGLYEAAERLLDEYVSQESRAVIAMAAFKGRRGQVAEAFGMLEEARRNQPAYEILPVALEILRYYPKEATRERCDLLEQWATGALGTEVDPQRIKLLLAELYDLQGRYDDVVKIYRELLADPKITLDVKAKVQNNLAFVLAVVNPSPERAAEARQLVEAAIRVIGPRSDLLDTRAMVSMAQGKVKDAAEDLRWALLDGPAIAKYYHLAQVEKGLGNLDAAREALVKAQKLDRDYNVFTPAEQQGFEKLQRELN